VQAYLLQHGVDLKTTSVIKQMRHFLAHDGPKPETRTIVKHLLVTKQKDDLESASYFPLDVDLVAAARQLIADLFPN